MIVLTLKLLLAHILGDFVLQPLKWVENKADKKFTSPYLYMHALVHGALVLLLLGSCYWIGAVIITVTHFIIDLIKVSINPNKCPRFLFFLDQFAHLSVVAYVINLYEPYTLSFELLNSSKLLLFIIAALSVTMVSSIVIRVIMKPWVLDGDKGGRNDEQLKNAGHYIGMLERLFVFSFVVLQQWQAIGFLFAAKSVFRFNDLSKAEDRKLTEYVLIGTFLSFGCAFSIGLVVNYINGKL